MASTGPAAIPRRQVLDRYQHVRDDHLRYMQKWGLIRPVRSGVETAYAFQDLAVIRDADAQLAEGASFRAVLRSMLSARAGQLTLDFRSEAPPAKVLRIRRREPPPLAALMGAPPDAEPTTAEQFFAAASLLDDGNPANVDDACRAYRRALEADPYMVPALINLANLRYSRGRNHEAQACYRDALRLNPTYAEAHFYLAVTLEKTGQSHDARPHWRAYQHLAPNGEWVELAREFSD